MIQSGHWREKRRIWKLCGQRVTGNSMAIRASLSLPLSLCLTFSPVFPKPRFIDILMRHIWRNCPHFIWTWGKSQKEEGTECSMWPGEKQKLVFPTPFWCYLPRQMTLVCNISEGHFRPFPLWPSAIVLALLSGLEATAVIRQACCAIPRKWGPIRPARHKGNIN